MNRLTVIQDVINKVKAHRYLEIGVFKGDVLFNLKAPERIAVDPKFNFSWRERTIRMLGLKGIRFYEMPSNDFFQKHTDLLKQRKVDVAFVDGLHNFEQSLADVENSLKYLDDKGVIIVHDCNPPTEANAYPVKHSINEAIEKAARGEIPGWNGTWNGDVWKTVVYLRSKYDNLSIFTLDVDWGLAIITRGKPLQKLSYTKEQVEQMTYKDLESNRTGLLNLQPPSYLELFLAGKR